MESAQSRYKEGGKLGLRGAQHVGGHPDRLVKGHLVDLEGIGEVIADDKKIAIGVIDHHTLQVERAEEVAATIRHGLEHIPAERLVIASDCGMGREGMSRRHAANKLIAIVQGNNIVRRELGLPEADCLAGVDKYSLVEEG